MAFQTLDRALYDAGLDSRSSQAIRDNPLVAKAVVYVAKALCEVIGMKGVVPTKNYRGKADTSRLPEVVEKVRKRDGRVRVGKVAEELGVSARVMSGIFRLHPETRDLYYSLVRNG